ncbi:beta-lactamase class A [Secundilactobacillus pentosiphilus]|uniref:Beta-lactamase class A n=1 Tax=Secundilactobacillus pentosiphilus TaxID=1714682 RepID=A0A1Z5ILE3_9LACO|nr:beta-lactamase class A [Secundilactobacillus pentosiphilus]
MKFGFSKLVGLMLLCAVGISGCSKANSHASKAQSKVSTSKVAASSSHAKAASSAPKAISQTDSAQREIRIAEQKCVASAYGQTSVYAVNLKTKHPAILHNRTQRSASVIKLFIMVTAFRQIKAGQLSLNQEVRVPKADRVGGTGELAQENVSQLTVSKLLTLMIRNSDNSAPTY